MTTEFATTVFILLFGLVFYTYLGYGILLYTVLLVKRFSSRLKLGFRNQKAVIPSSPAKLYTLAHTPRVTMIIAAYNEESCIEAKLRNTFSLQYPLSKLSVIVITDGSTDRTPQLAKRFAGAFVLHQEKREGKAAALNRAMSFVTTPIVVFSDANTLLAEEALLELMNPYQNPKVGAVSGEKRIISGELASGSNAGEGIYWKYESLLKKWDAELYSLVGAAGELFSIRTELYDPLAADTLLDDFIISMNIAGKGYRIAYEPKAYALETASQNIHEEFKRKVRISTGGVQSMIKLRAQFSPLTLPKLWWQFISHRALRWSVTPFALFMLYPLNLYLALSGSAPFVLLLGMHTLFYCFALLGLLLERKRLRLKLLFIPFYFIVMNAAVVIGWGRFFRRSQSVLWERSKRENLES